MNKVSNCLNCKTLIEFNTTQSTGKYCSNKCQQIFQTQKILHEWKSGVYDGAVSKNSATSISRAIRNYLFRKYNSSCSECGWNRINIYTQKIPLHIHHIDGNALNCKEENLQLICANCHSLTENFGKRNLNSKRKKKQITYV